MPNATHNSPIKLLSTDFDGTLINHQSSPPVVPEFFSALAELQSRGVLWAVNTGRVRWHIEEGLKELPSPIEPDFLLTSEREVFHRGPDGVWTDFGDWNARCLATHDTLFEQSSQLLEDIESYLAKHTLSHPIYEGARLIGLVADSEAEMDQLCLFLTEEITRVPGFHFMRNTIYVRFCHEDYNKGTALSELGRLLNFQPENIFATGDHYNDIPMLDGQHAKWVACPSNSVEAVKKQVLQAGGFVANHPCSAGVLEALRHFKALSPT